MDIVTLDFETYYASDYTLKGSKGLSPPQYVRDDKFYVHGCSAKFNDAPAFWHTHDDLVDFFNSIPWDTVTLNAFNTGFDALVLWEKYGHAPARLVDGMSMARPILPVGAKCDLATVVKLLGIGEKGDELTQSKGVKRLDPELEKTLANYAINDAELAWGVYKKLLPEFSQFELDLIDWTVRVSTQGKILIDVPRASKELNQIRKDKARLIKNSGYTRKQLNSGPQFASILKSLSIEPPVKISKTTGKPALAFSQKDLDFIRLQAKHPEHKHLWDARAAVASNIDITRTERLINIGSIGNRTLPMMMNYAGAHTFRWSGAGKVNVQNLRRGGELRKSLIAPPGYVIVVADSAQIELRMNAWFCDQQDSLEILRAGGDIYSYTASDHYGYKVEKKTHPDERQFGKLLELGLGYTMGWGTFQMNAAIGFMGLPPIILSDEDAYITVQKYRASHANIYGMSKTLNNLLPLMTEKDCDQSIKCVDFKHDRVEMPNGVPMYYHFLDNPNGDSFWYGMPGCKRKIYGGLFLENIIQSLARHVVAEQMLRIDKELKSHDPFAGVIGMTHDENIAICKESQADDILKMMIDEMSITPTWAPGLPLAAEGGYDYCYSK